MVSVRRWGEQPHDFAGGPRNSPTQLARAAGRTRAVENALVPRDARARVGAGENVFPCARRDPSAAFRTSSSARTTHPAVPVATARGVERILLAHARVIERPAARDVEPYGRLHTRSTSRNHVVAKDLARFLRLVDDTARRRRGPRFAFASLVNTPGRVALASRALRVEPRSPVVVA